jgi:predicted GIY-YIG superfamily endonuclease
MESKTALYRHFNKENELLYVGISLNALNRLGQHKEHAHWFSDITDVRIEHFETRELALKAERDAVVKENPKHNIKLRIPEKQIKEMEKSAARQSAIEHSKKQAVRNHVVFKICYSIDEVADMLMMRKQEIQKHIDENRLTIFHVEGKPSWQYPDKAIIKPRISGWALIDFIEYLQQKEI